jgi:hypothetical protein
VQLEIGSTATPLEKLDPRLDLSNAMRFFQLYPGLVVSGYGAAAGAVTSGHTIPPMRANPTATFANQTYTNASGYAVNTLHTNNVSFYVIATATGSASGYADVSLSADL